MARGKYFDENLTYMEEVHILWEEINTEINDTTQHIVNHIDTTIDFLLWGQLENSLYFTRNIRCLEIMTLQHYCEWRVDNSNGLIFELAQSFFNFYRKQTSKKLKLKFNEGTALPYEPFEDPDKPDLTEQWQKLKISRNAWIEEQSKFVYHNYEFEVEMINDVDTEMKEFIKEGVSGNLLQNYRAFYDDFNRSVTSLRKEYFELKYIIQDKLGPMEIWQESDSKLDRQFLSNMFQNYHRFQVPFISIFRAKALS